MSPDLNSTLRNARAALLAERCDGGWWEGSLSSSALSTATALIALHFVNAERHRDLIRGGLQWLNDNQNDDGGWGDTPISFSNISTSLLCWSALTIADSTSFTGPAVARVESWISHYVGSLQPRAIAAAVKARYGKDRTFSVPILMTCALAGCLGDTPAENWAHVLPLPFELAAFPQSLFGALRLPVVSYALPALIAIGYARSAHRPSLPPLRWIRRAVWPRTSRLLATIQPTSGGFLEATPLTSFVTMALAGSGQTHHPVVPRAVEFLSRSVRPDGSWPIDTNLATWTTTLATKALLDHPADEDTNFPPESRPLILDWLLGQQYRCRHPYTNSPPGGWAWTDLPGGVPDADDTPGALLALRALVPSGETDSRCLEAAELAVTWLLGLQNRDGGIPTFCRGWGALPFDRSSPDLTAHALRAWSAWLPDLSPPLARRVKLAQQRALRYLHNTQRPDGSWHPLWFGNQHRDDEANPTYGTAMVLLGLHSLPQSPEGISCEPLIARAVRSLRDSQNEDGGWGAGPTTPSSIEETALALDALGATFPGHDETLDRAAAWLSHATDQGTHFPPSPIGFYFAKLWYFEKLYPLVWTVSALSRYASLQKRPTQRSQV